MAMQHKNIELDSWIENMQKATTEGDEISLYILVRMYNKQVFVHDSVVWVEHLAILNRG